MTICFAGHVPPIVSSLQAAAEAQHRWLEYQNRVAERAKQQHEEVEMQLQYGGGVVGLL